MLMRRNKRGPRDRCRCHKERGHFGAVPGNLSVDTVPVEDSCSCHSPGYWCSHIAAAIDRTKERSSQYI
jgi:hypothetical protein